MKPTRSTLDLAHAVDRINERIRQGGWGTRYFLSIDRASTPQTVMFLGSPLTLEGIGTAHPGTEDGIVEIAGQVRDAIGAQLIDVGAAFAVPVVPVAAIVGFTGDSDVNAANVIDKLTKTRDADRAESGRVIANHLNQLFQLGLKDDAGWAAVMDQLAKYATGERAVDKVIRDCWRGAISAVYRVARIENRAARHDADVNVDLMFAVQAAIDEAAQHVGHIAGLSDEQLKEARVEVAAGGKPDIYALAKAVGHKLADTSPVDAVAAIYRVAEMKQSDIVGNPTDANVLLAVAVERVIHHTAQRVYVAAGNKLLPDIDFHPGSKPGVYDYAEALGDLLKDKRIDLHDLHDLHDLVKRKHGANAAIIDLDALHDLETHRASWGEALAMMVKLAEHPDAGIRRSVGALIEDEADGGAEDGDRAGYWKHEQRAFERLCDYFDHLKKDPSGGIQTTTPNRVASVAAKARAKAAPSTPAWQRETECCECGKSTMNESYMLDGDVWRQAAAGVKVNSAGRVLLHLECAEKRLARRLTPEDFTGAPINSALRWAFKNAAIRNADQQKHARAFDDVDRALLNTATRSPFLKKQDFDDVRHLAPYERIPLKLGDLSQRHFTFDIPVHQGLRSIVADLTAARFREIEATTRRILAGESSAGMPLTSPLDLAASVEAVGVLTIVHALSAPDSRHFILRKAAIVDLTRHDTVQVVYSAHKDEKAQAAWVTRLALFPWPEDAPVPAQLVTLNDEKVDIEAAMRIRDTFLPALTPERVQDQREKLKRFSAGMRDDIAAAMERGGPFHPNNPGSLNVSPTEVPMVTQEQAADIRRTLGLADDAPLNIQHFLDAESKKREQARTPIQPSTDNQGAPEQTARDRMTLVEETWAGVRKALTLEEATEALARNATIEEQPILDTSVKLKLSIANIAPDRDDYENARDEETLRWPVRMNWSMSSEKMQQRIVDDCVVWLRRRLVASKKAPTPTPRDIRLEAAVLAKLDPELRRQWHVRGAEIESLPQAATQRRLLLHVKRAPQVTQAMAWSWVPALAEGNADRVLDDCVAWFTKHLAPTALPSALTQPWDQQALADAHITAEPVTRAAIAIRKAVSAVRVEGSDLVMGMVRDGKALADALDVLDRLWGIPTAPKAKMDPPPEPTTDPRGVVTDHDYEEDPHRPNSCGVIAHPEQRWTKDQVCGRCRADHVRPAAPVVDDAPEGIPLVGALARLTDARDHTISTLRAALVSAHAVFDRYARQHAVSAREQREHGSAEGAAVAEAKATSNAAHAAAIAEALVGDDGWRFNPNADPRESAWYRDGAAVDITNERVGRLKKVITAAFNIGWGSRIFVEGRGTVADRAKAKDESRARAIDIIVNRKPFSTIDEHDDGAEPARSAFDKIAAAADAAPHVPDEPRHVEVAKALDLARQLQQRPGVVGEQASSIASVLAGLLLKPMQRIIESDDDLAAFIGEALDILNAGPPVPPSRAVIDAADKLYEAVHRAGVKSWAKTADADEPADLVGASSLRAYAEMQKHPLRVALNAFEQMTSIEELDAAIAEMPSEAAAVLRKLRSAVFFGSSQNPVVGKGQVAVDADELNALEKAARKLGFTGDLEEGIVDFATYALNTTREAIDGGLDDAKNIDARSHLKRVVTMRKDSAALARVSALMAGKPSVVDADTLAMAIEGPAV